MGSVWVELSSDQASKILSAGKLYDVTVAPRHPFDGLDPAIPCSADAVELVVEGKWYRQDSLKKIDAMLAQNNIEVCRSLEVSYNQPSQNIGPLERQLLELPWLILLVISTAIIWRIYSRSMRLRLDAEKKWKYWVVYGLLGTLPLYAFSIIFAKSTGFVAGDYLVPALSNAPSLAATASICLLIPFMEELGYRAWFISFASNATKPTVAVLLSVAIFVLAHGTFDWASMIFYGVAGGFYAVLWLRSKSLIVCTVAHCTYNFMILLTY